MAAPHEIHKWTDHHLQPQPNSRFPLLKDTGYPSAGNLYPDTHQPVYIGIAPLILLDIFYHFS